MNQVKLTIELIPRTAHGINLRAAGRKSQWETITRLTVARADGRCEICGCAPTGKHPLETHEVWNWDEATRIQSLVRTTVLCPWCHHAKHPGIAQKLGFTDAMHRHMMRINGWTAEELVVHTKEAWRQWLRLSMIQWTFNPDLPGIIAALELSQIRTPDR